MESSASSALLSTAPVTVGPVVLHVDHARECLRRDVCDLVPA